MLIPARVSRGVTSVLSSYRDPRDQNLTNTDGWTDGRTTCEKNRGRSRSRIVASEIGQFALSICCAFFGARRLHLAHSGLEFNVYRRYACSIHTHTHTHIAYNLFLRSYKNRERESRNSLITRGRDREVNDPLNRGSDGICIDTHRYLRLKWSINRYLVNNEERKRLDDRVSSRAREYNEYNSRAIGTFDNFFRRPTSTRTPIPYYRYYR